MLTARVNDQYDYMSLIVTEGAGKDKSRITLTYGRYGDRASASGKVDKDLLDEALKRFSAKRDAMKADGKLGDVMAGVLKTAQGCSSIAQFVRKM